MAQHGLSLVPVDFDPFASDAPTASGLSLVPVDFDPFADDAPVPAAALEPFPEVVTPDDVLPPPEVAATPNLPRPGEPEATAFETFIATFRSVPDMAKQAIGGFVQALPSTAPPPDPSTLLFSPQAFEAAEASFTAAQRGEQSELGRFAGEVANEAADSLIANHPNVDPESLKGYAFDIGQNILRMVPVVGVSIATGSPAAGLSIMGLEVYGRSFNEARRNGRTPAEANMDAVFNSLAETIPERIPLGILMKSGGSFVPRVLKTMGAEALQEQVTEALQIGYDIGVLDKDMTWGAALQRMKRAGIVGAGVGGSLAVATAPLVSGRQIPQGVRERAGQEAAVRALTPSQDILTPGDRASPIPDNIIAEGKAAVQESVENEAATSSANVILQRNNLPAIGARVTVTLPDGEPAAGEVVDSFTETNAELDLAEDGIKIALDAGGTFEEFVTDLAQRGIVIAPEVVAVEPDVAGPVAIPDVSVAIPEPGLEPVDFDPFEGAAPAQPSQAPAQAQEPVSAPAVAPEAETATTERPSAAPAEESKQEQLKAKIRLNRTAETVTEDAGGNIEAVPAADIQVDAELFQFKVDTDTRGVSERLQGVTEFDERLAGLSLIYEFEDGRRFIVDGHQRLALAKRIMEADPSQNIRLNSIVLRETDGITPGQARSLAAGKNIAEGTGTAIDAAKVIRENADDLPPLPPRSALVGTGRALAKLGDEAFGMVANGVVKDTHAAVVARLATDESFQVALLRLLAKTEPGTVVEAESIVRQGIAAGFDRRTEATLFGEEEIVDSLFSERAKILSRALTALRRDRATFNTLVNRESDILGAGNVLDRASNVERLSDNDRALATLQALANRKGPVSDALTEAARDAKASGGFGTATLKFTRTLKEAIEGGIRSGDEAGGPGRSVEPGREVRGSAQEASGAGETAPEVAAAEAATPAPEQAESTPDLTPPAEPAPGVPRIGRLVEEHDYVDKIGRKFSIQVRVNPNGSFSVGTMRTGAWTSQTRFDNFEEARAKAKEIAARLNAEVAPTTEQTEQGEQIVVPGAEAQTPETARREAREREKNFRAEQEFAVKERETKLRRGGQTGVDTQEGGLFEAETGKLFGEDEEGKLDQFGRQEEKILGVPTIINPKSVGPFTFKSSFQQTVEFDAEGRPVKTEIIHAATREEYVARLKEAQARKPKLSLGPVNPRFAGDVKRIGANLTARLKKLGIADKVALRVVEDLEAVVGGRRIKAEGAFEPGVSFDPVGLILVSLKAQDGQWTLDHEVIHALREYGLFRDAEWTTLTKAAQADTERMGRMRDQRRGQGLTEEQIVEEVVADLFADWSVGRTQVGGFIKSTFERIKAFLTAFGRVLTQRGYASVNDIFGAVESGEVGRRDPVAETGPMGMSQAFMDESDSTKLPPAPKLSLAGSRPRSPPATFDDAKTEARWQDARKGAASQETLVRRMGDWWDFIKAGFARHYINLPNEARFSDAREQFRKLEAAPQASKEQVIRILRQITDGMTETDLDLFTRKVVLDDLSFEADEDHDLPFGMSPADVAQELAKVDLILARRGDLTAKLRQRKLIVRGIANQLVEAGVLNREQIKNPAYYRHQVLDYARAQVKYAQGAGKKVRSPHWARRMGSMLDINANLLEAEFEWLHKAMIDIATAKTIEWVKNSEHNVRDSVIRAARQSNDERVQAKLGADQDTNGFLDKQGNPSSPLTEEWKKFRQNIAFGMSTVRKAIKDGAITNIPKEFKAVADGLSESSADNETSLFPFLAWMMDNDKAGASGAGLVFKAISQRKQWTKELLGRAYADTSNVGDLVKQFAPEGHVAWQPDEGNLLFTAKTIPEHVMDRMLNRIAESGAGEISSDELLAALNSVRSMLAVGGPKFQMVLPEEMANTLNSIRDDHVDGLIEAVFTQPIRYWKRWVLINPRRVLAYNLNNLSGDLDAVIAGNPRALRHMPRAIKELYAVMLKGETPSERYREAVDRGVFDSGLTVQEIPDINLLSEFEQLINAPKVTQPGRFALSKLMKVWRGLQRYTWFRENWLRYASYLDYAERLEGGEDMASIGYGAARREMVDAIRDDKDRAALLARELVGDYGAISHFGKGIRRSIIPFYSWMEINTKRYWRFGINAWSQGVGQGLKTTGLVGATLGLRTTVYLGLRMAVFYGMVQIWNNLVFGDEEDEMRVEDRVRLHLNLGRDANGDIRLVRLQGALSDFLGWIGFDDAVAGIVEVEKGRATWSDVVKTMAKAPVNKIASGLTPVLKMPIELATGQSYWPDVSRPRPIRDKGRHVARLFSIENEYDLIFDRPSRGFGRSLKGLGIVKTRNIGETAYGRIRGMAFDFTRRLRGSEGFSTFNTERSRALHTWRLAKRFGDASAARKARRHLTELGVTSADLRSSIKRAHPLGGIPIKHRGRFLRSLTSREQKSLELANRWYRETYLQ